jgi:hypothetical protein
VRDALGTLAVLVAAALLGATVGAAGSFLQALTVVDLPVGVVLGLAASLVVFVGSGAVTGARRTSIACVAGWVLAVVALSVPRAEGDVVLTDSLASYVWLFGGVLLGGVAAGWPHGRAGALGAGNRRTPG